MDGIDECEGMFRHGEIAQVVSNDKKSWTLDIGWNKQLQKYWLSINGMQFDDMDKVPGKSLSCNMEEESKIAGALKIKLKTQKTLPTMASSDSGDYDNECNQSNFLREQQYL